MLSFWVKANHEQNVIVFKPKIWPWQHIQTQENKEAEVIGTREIEK